MFVHNFFGDGQPDTRSFVLFAGVQALELDASIPPELRDRLTGWNNDYRPLIALTPAEWVAPARSDKIAELDATGRRLAGELKAIFPDAVLRYASEARGDTGFVREADR